MPFLPSLWKPVAIGALALALVAVPAAYLKGRSDGRVSQLKATISQLEERGLINEAVNSADIADLCIELGGLPDECAE